MNNDNAKNSKSPSLSVDANPIVSRRHVLALSASVFTLSLVPDANAVFTQLLDRRKNQDSEVPSLIVSNTINIGRGENLVEILGEFGKAVKVLKEVVQDLPQQTRGSLRRVAYDSQTYRITSPSTAPYPSHYATYYNYLGYNNFHFYRDNASDINTYQNSLTRLQRNYPEAYDSFTSRYVSSIYKYFGDMLNWKYANGYSSSFYKINTNEEYTWIYIPIPNSKTALAFVSRGGYYKSVYPELWRLMTAEHNNVFPNNSSVINASQPYKPLQDSRATDGKTTVNFKTFDTPSGKTVKYSAETYRYKTTGDVQATDSPRQGDWNLVGIQDPKNPEDTLVKFARIETKEG